MRKQTLALWVLGILGLFVALRSFLHIVTTFAPDFSVFYGSAKNLLSGVNIYRDSTLYTGLGYPPFSLLPFLPFTLVDYQAAQTIWVALSFLLVPTSVFLTLRTFQRKWTWSDFSIVFFLTILAFPTRFTLGMGQVNLLALASLLVSLALAGNKKEIASGALFGFLLLIKPHAFLLFPIFVLTGRWHIVWSCLLVVVGSILFTGLLFGFSLYEVYMSTLPQLLAFTGRELYYNQGLGAFFSRSVPPYAQVATMVTSLFVYGFALRTIVNRRLSVFDAFVCLLPVFLLVEPLAWQHHFVFLLPTFVWAWKRVKSGKELSAVLISYCLIAANIKDPNLVGGPFRWLVLSHVFMGNVMLTVLVFRNMLR